MFDKKQQHQDDQSATVPEGTNEITGLEQTEVATDEPTTAPAAENESTVEATDEPAATEPDGEQTLQAPVQAVPQPYRSKKRWIVAVVVLLALAGISAALYVLLWNKDDAKQQQPSRDSIVQVKAGNGRFAPYKELDVNATPSIPQVAVASDLSNVENLDYFYGFENYDYSAQIKKLLATNQFAIGEGQSKEYYPVYESNRYAYVPNFVTTDSMLHNYHIMFDYLLKSLEEDQFSGKLNDLSKSMLDSSKQQYDALKGTEWETAAKRSVALFAVGAKLADPTTEVPTYVQTEVNQELALVDAHTETRADSPVINMGATGDAKDKLMEDYTQYVPRGHYDKSDQLKTYFKSMMWYGRMTFRFKNVDEVRSAALITMSLSADKNKQLWDALYEPTNFFVGKSDDVTFYQLTELLKGAYGNSISLSTLTTNKPAFETFIKSADALEPPQLNSIPIFNSTVEPDREAATKGFRVMGQRFTVDASIFQRLIDREVTGRMLPKALDIPAAVGSDEALSILKATDETTSYPNYDKNMESTRKYLNGLSLDDWTQNLYWSWLHTLRPLADAQKSQGYPGFMQNQAWQRKELNTYLGSWTELKHDTVLYAKQVYGELGGGGPEARDDRGYVEPNPELYGRLASTIRMTIDGLQSRGLLDETMQRDLERLETLATSLKAISEKELNHQALSSDDYTLIRNYGGDLEHFWLEVNQDEPEFKQLGQRDFLDQNPGALVSDVATDPNGQVLEEATGHVAPIYVIFELDGKLRIAEGGVYSHYEFTKPQTERMTDKDWWKVLGSRNIPDSPTWTDMFRAVGQ